jgi:hypothetical protein
VWELTHAKVAKDGKGYFLGRKNPLRTQRTWREVWELTHAKVAKDSTFSPKEHSF